MCGGHESVEEAIMSLLGKGDERGFHEQVFCIALFFLKQ
jgi:hypothetical protein